MGSFGIITVLFQAPLPCMTHRTVLSCSIIDALLINWKFNYHVEWIASDLIRVVQS